MEVLASFKAFTEALTPSATPSTLGPCTSIPKSAASEYGRNTVCAEVPAGIADDNGDVPWVHFTEAFGDR